MLGKVLSTWQTMKGTIASAIIVRITTFIYDGPGKDGKWGSGFPVGWMEPTILMLRVIHVHYFPFIRGCPPSGSRVVPHIHVRQGLRLRFPRCGQPQRVSVMCPKPVASKETGNSVSPSYVH